MTKSEAPDIKHAGLDARHGQSLRLDEKWAYNAIKRSAITARSLTGISASTAAR
jgi:hypothetical protein